MEVERRDRLTHLENNVSSEAATTSGSRLPSGTGTGGQARPPPSLKGSTGHPAKQLVSAEMCGASPYGTLSYSIPGLIHRSQEHFAHNE